MAADIQFDDKQVKVVNSANQDSIIVNDNGVEVKNGNGVINVNNKGEVSIKSPLVQVTGNEVKLDGSVMLFKKPGERPFPIGITPVNINQGWVDVLRTIGFMASQINQMQEHIKVIEAKLGLNK